MTPVEHRNMRRAAPRLEPRSWRVGATPMGESGVAEIPAIGGGR
jgi:hypothetical protein